MLTLRPCMKITSLPQARRLMPRCLPRPWPVTPQFRPLAVVVALLTDSTLRPLAPQKRPTTWAPTARLLGCQITRAIQYMPCFNRQIMKNRTARSIPTQPRLTPFSTESITPERHSVICESLIGRRGRLRIQRDRGPFHFVAIGVGAENLFMLD